MIAALKIAQLVLIIKVQTRSAPRKLSSALNDVLLFFILVAKKSTLAIDCMALLSRSSAILRICQSPFGGDQKFRKSIEKVSISISGGRLIQTI
jgi:hypothetical protein